MRLYLSADIEGTCGIADWAETERATMDDYRPFAAQMTAEVAAACEGAVAAGADALEIEVHDCPAKAWSDGAQALTPDQFADAMRRIALIREAVTADLEEA